MSVNIRLSTIGKKHQKTYRIVVSHKKSRRNGKPLETLGIYNPQAKPRLVKVDEKRLQYWIEKGAKKSDIINKILHLKKQYERIT